MRKKPEVTVDSERVVTVKFGKGQPTLAQVAEVAHRHGLSDYQVSVFNASYSGAWVVSLDPSWTAKFTRVESL